MTMFLSEYLKKRTITAVKAMAVSIRRGKLRLCQGEGGKKQLRDHPRQIREWIKKVEFQPF